MDLAFVQINGGMVALFRPLATLTVLCGWDTLLLCLLEDLATWLLFLFFLLQLLCFLSVFLLRVQPSDFSLVLSHHTIALFFSTVSLLQWICLSLAVYIFECGLELALLFDFFLELLLLGEGLIYAVDAN